MTREFSGVAGYSECSRLIRRDAPHNQLISPLEFIVRFLSRLSIAVSALSGIVPTPVQLAGAAITVAALVMNNLYQRQRVQRESASPYGSGTDKREPCASQQI